MKKGIYYVVLYHQKKAQFCTKAALGKRAFVAYLKKGGGRAVI